MLDLGFKVVDQRQLLVDAFNNLCLLCYRGKRELHPGESLRTQMCNACCDRGDLPIPTCTKLSSADDQRKFRQHSFECALANESILETTAGQLVAQYGSLEGVLEHVDELSPARGRALREHAVQARASKELATMRRDLPLQCDPAELVLSPPDRSRLKEMFRQYEFRNLLQRVDVIDEAIPAAPMNLEGVSVPWREGELSPPQGEAGIAVEDGRVALLLSTLEPALIVVLGLIVGGIVVSMYLPLFELVAQLS